jgi:Signal transduction histidine kinase
MMKLRAEQEIIKQNEQLRASNDELKKSNAELDNLVYSVSHNLRGPLSTIQGLVYLLKLEKSDLGVIPDMILSSAARLDTTIKEIINYSRNTRVELLSEPINLREMIDSVLKELEYDQLELNIRLDIDLEEEFVWSDRFRLRIILNNILSNSLKYADRSKETTVLRITSRRDNECLIVEVQDNGIGISPEVLPFVYNMFYRGTEKSDGAGLGLYIVREAVERLGGKMALKSEVHQGTNVKLLLPIVLNAETKNLNIHQAYG